MSTRLRSLAVVVLCSGLLLPAHDAAAGTLFRQSDQQFNFSADTGESNAIAVSSGSVAGRFVFSDLSQPITLGEGTSECTGGGTNQVSCPLVSQVFIDAGDSNDGITIAESVPMTFRIDGEDGDDSIDGGGLGDVIDGGDGTDNLDGEGGDDQILPEAGTDDADGGAGIDTIDYDDSRSSGVTVDLSSGIAPEGDTLAGFENIQGTFFDDVLTGNDGDNVIIGQPGNDTLDGKGGFDVVSYRGF
jgi:Ca2+-binding RTX toxin-like protein